jgi:hypothetical protein
MCEDGPFEESLGFTEIMVARNAYKHPLWPLRHSLHDTSRSDVEWQQVMLTLGPLK